MSLSNNNVSLINLNSQFNPFYSSITIDPSGNVGVGKTIPSTNLDISGNINLSGIISGSGASLISLNATNITSGVLSVNRGGTGATNLTSGSILVGNGTTTILQPTNFVWDNANSRLGIGKNNPGTTLDVNGTITGTLFSGSGASLTSLTATNISGNINVAQGGTGKTTITANTLLGAGSMANIIQEITAGSGITISNNTISAIDLISSSLIAWYKFNNKTADLIINSIDSNSNLTNTSTTFDSINYKVGNGSVYFGVNNYLSLPSSFNPYTIANNNGISFVFWLKIDPTSGSAARLLDLEDQIFIYRVGTSISLAIRQAVGGDINYNIPSMIDNKWHHIVWCISKTGIWDVYIDNVKLSVNITFEVRNLTYTNMWIGRSAFTNDGWIIGNMDDFRIYNRVITPTEVDFIYNCANVNNITTLSGNVGIGKTNPSSTLDVSGDINITGSYKVNGSTFVTSQWTTTGSNIYYNGGNIGIGTTAPEQKLEIWSDGVSDNIYLQARANNTREAGLILKRSAMTWYIQNKGSGFGTAQNNLSFSTTTTSYLDITSSGNVGIGTVNPTNILQVGAGGRLRISNGATDYTLIGTKDPDDANNTRIVLSGNTRASFSGNIEYVTTSTGSHIWYSGGTTERMRLLNNGNLGIGVTNPSYGLDVVNSGTYMATFRHTNLTAGLGIGYSSIEAIGTNATNDIYLRSKSTGFIALQTNSVTRLIVNGTGNVGIGKTNPSTTLDVNGTITSTGLLCSGGAIVIDTSNNVNIDSGVLYVDGSNNRVGIGTTQPNQKLHITGDTRIEGNLTVNGTLTQVNTNVSNTEQLLITNDGTGPAVIVNQTGAQPILEIQDDGATCFKIFDGGNLGIGTNTKNVTVDISGNLVLSGTITGSGTGLSALNASNISSGTLAITQGGTGVTSLASGSILIGNGNNPITQPANFVWDNTNNRVGIGKTNPTTTLDVNGTVTATLFSGSGASLTSISTSQITGLDTTLAGKQSTLTAGTNITISSNTISSTSVSSQWITGTSLIYYNSGTVGIGLTNPSTTYKLDVNGDVNISLGSKYRINGTEIGNYTGGTGITISGNTITNSAPTPWKSGTLANSIYYNTGIVSIGTTDTTYNTNVYQKLHIKANGETDIAGLYFSTNYNGYSSFARTAICVVGRGSYSYSRGDMYFCLNTDSVISEIDLTRDTKMKITWEGNIGIGKTNPSTKLDINGTTTSVLFSGSGANLTTLNATNITSGMLNVSQGGTGATTLLSGQLLIGNGTGALLQTVNLSWNNTSNTLSAPNFVGSGSGITALNASNISSGTLTVPQGGTGCTSLDEIYFDTSGGILSLKNISSSGQWDTNNNNFYTLTNVGIGTSNINNKLDISDGDLNISNANIKKTITDNLLPIDLIPSNWYQFNEDPLNSTIVYDSGNTPLNLTIINNFYNNITNMISWYKFDTSSNLGYDNCNKYNLTNYNTTFNTTNAKNELGSVLFNGLSYLEINRNDLGISNFSISLWIDPINTASVFQTIASCRNIINSLTYGWIIYIYNNNLEFWTGTGSNSWNGMGNTVYSNFSASSVWIHLVITFNNGNIIAYINGSQVYTRIDTTFNLSNITILRIGAGDTESATPNYYLSNGSLIDDFRIYNRVLNPTEILYLYNYNLVLEYPPVGLSNDGGSATISSATVSGQSYGNGTYNIIASNNKTSDGGSDISFLFNKITSGISQFVTFDNYNSYINGGLYYGTTSTTYNTNQIYMGEWVQIQLPCKIVLTLYGLYNQAATNISSAILAPRDWILLGSNDGINFTLIDTQINIDGWNFGGDYKTFTVSNNNNAYMYFRICFGKSNTFIASGAYNTTVGCRVAEWKLFGIRYDKLLLTNISDYPSNNTTNMILWNKFDNNLSDSSPNNLVLTPYNSPTFSNTNYIRGSHAISFAGGTLGTSQYVTLPKYNFGINNELTFTCWVRFTDTASNARILDFGNGSTSNNIIISRNTTTTFLNFQIYNNTTSYSRISNNIISNNTWFHITWVLIKNSTTVTNSTWKIYINGEIDQVINSNTYFPNNIDLSFNYLAKSNNASIAYFAGQIDDLRIYNKALSDNEIYQIFGMPLIKTLGNTTNYNTYQNAYLWNNNPSSSFDNSYLLNNDNITIKSLLYNFHINDGFTIHFVFKAINFNNTSQIFYIGNNNNNLIRIYIQNSKLYFSVDSNVIYTDNLNINTWYIFDLVYSFSNNISNLCLYQNNISVALLSGIYNDIFFNVNLTGLIYTIGNYTDDNNDASPCYIQDFRIFSNVLNTNQQSSLQNGSTSYNSSNMIENYGVERWKSSLTYYTGGNKCISYTDGNVGIGKYNPNTALDVNGTITGTLFSGSGSSLSQLNSSNITSGILSIKYGGTGLTSLNPKSILVGNGTGPLTLSTNFIWDSNSNRLGVGKTNPTTTLDVNGTVTATLFSGSGASLTTLNATSISGNINVAQGGTGSTNLTSGQLLIGNGTSALLQTANLTWNNTSNTLSTTNFVVSRIGINKTTPYTNTALDVNGNIKANEVKIKNSYVVNSYVYYEFESEYLLTIDSSPNNKTLINKGGIYQLNSNKNSILLQNNNEVNIQITDWDIFNDLTISGWFKTNNFINSDKLLDFSYDNQNIKIYKNNNVISFTINNNILLETSYDNLNTWTYILWNIKKSDSIQSSIIINNDNFVFYNQIEINTQTPFIKYPRYVATSETYVYPDGTNVKIIGSSRYNTTDHSWYQSFNNSTSDFGWGASSSKYTSGIANTTYRTEYSGEYIQIDLGEAILLANYKIYQRSGWNARLPKSFRIYGSNDINCWTNINHSSWVLIDEKIDLSSYTIGSFTIANNIIAYQFYVLICYKTFGGDFVQFSEFELYGYPYNFKLGSITNTGNVYISNFRILNIPLTSEIQNELYTPSSTYVTLIDDNKLQSSINNLNVSNINTGTLSVNYGGTGSTNLNLGSILIGNGTNALLQPTNFVWDDVNTRVGIGKTDPSTTLDVNGTVTATLFSGSGLNLTNLNASNISGNINVTQGGTGSTSLIANQLLVGNGTSTLIQSANLSWDNTSNTLSATNFVGSGSGLTSLNASNISGTINVAQGGTGSTSLTANQILVGNGTNTLIQSTNLSWDNTNNRLGVGTTSPISKLSINSRPLPIDPSKESYLSESPVLINYTDIPTSNITLNDPKPVLHLCRDGTSNMSYASRATFKLCRYENIGVLSRTRMDLFMTHDNYDDVNIMSFRSDKKVGIDKTNPSTTLDVNGTITATLFSGSGASLTSLSASNITGTLNVARGGTGSASLTSGQVLIGNGTGSLLQSANLSWDNTNNRLGIGKTNPSTTLDVNGDISLKSATPSALFWSGTITSLGRANGSGDYSTSAVAGDLILRSVGKVILQSGTGTGAIVIDTSNNVNIDSGVLYIDASNNNVGIGTTQPNKKLHVTGDARIEGNLTVNGTLTQINTNVSNTEQLLITNDGTGPAMIVNQTGAQPIIEFQDDGATCFKIFDGGNLGIGTTTKVVTVDISGNLKLSGSITGSGSGLSALNASNISSGTLNVSQGGIGSTTLTSGQLLIGNGTNALLQSANLTWDNSNNRLGIGITNPQNKLHISSGLTTPANSFPLKISASAIIDNGAQGTFIGLNTEDCSWSKCAMGHIRTSPYDVGDIAFLCRSAQDNTTCTMSDERMRIKSTGNVGIGITNPSYLLDVSGNLNAKGFFLNGVAFTGSYWTTNGTSIYYNTGNVGIGITNPTFKLEISPLDGATTDLISFKNSQGYGIYATSVSTTSRGNSLDFKAKDYNSGTVTTRDVLSLNITGNVGIGITNPANILQVGTGGRLRISNGTTDYTLLGTIDTDGATNTRIVLSGNTRGGSPGTIEYVATSTGSHIFYTTNSTSERMRITSGGNVGIGKTNPDYVLDVNGAINATELRVNGSVFTSSSSQWTTSGTNIYYNTGNIGIGITNPTNKLHIVHNSTNTTADAAGGVGLYVYNATNAASNNSVICNRIAGTTANKVIYCMDVSAGYGWSWYLNGNDTTNKLLRFHSSWDATSGTDRLVINGANGNIGIATNANISSKLTVNDIVIDRSTYDHSEAVMTITHPTVTSSTVLNDPKSIFHLCRQGTNGQSYGAKASFKLCRWENNGINSRSRLDITLAHGAYDDVNVMSIESDGSVGIGKTNPSTALDVNGTITATLFSGSGANLTSLNMSNALSGTLSVARGGTGAATLTANQLLIGNGTGAVIQSANLVWDNTNSRLGISKAAPAYPLDVTGSCRMTGELIVEGNKLVITGDSPTLYLRDSNNRTGMIHMNSDIMYFLNGNGANSDTWAVQPPYNQWALTINMANNDAIFGGSINAYGNITAYFSDNRLKTYISDIKDPLKIINKLKGFYYTPNDIAKSYGFKNIKQEIGLSAQDVQKVLPELISLAPFDKKTDEDGNITSKSGENYLTMSYERLAPVLVEAIKELNKENNDLKQENNDLKQKYDNLLQDIILIKKTLNL
jgi:hypothetical protein